MKFLSNLKSRINENKKSILAHTFRKKGKKGKQEDEDVDFDESFSNDEGQAVSEEDKAPKEDASEMSDEREEADKDDEMSDDAKKVQDIIKKLKTKNGKNEKAAEVAAGVEQEDLVDSDEGSLASIFGDEEDLSPKKRTAGAAMGEGQGGYKRARF